jgi:ActR/RegA family two-component response regulator
MNQDKEGFCRQTISLDSRTARLQHEEFESVPLFDATRRFSCIFLSTSTKDAARLNRHLSAAGIRVYLAHDTREAETLLAITSARILLIDIDRTIEPWLEILQILGASYPGMPKVVLTARHESAWSLILPRLALDVVPKPAHLGDLLGSLESAHSIEEDLSNPERAKENIRRVLARIRSASPAPTSREIHPNIERTNISTPHSFWRSIRARLSAMMDRVTHVWWKLVCHRTRKQDSHA